MTGPEAVLAAIDALDAAGVPYMLVGSFSRNVYSFERSTRDADFVIELGETSIAAVARQLGPALRLDPQMSFETVTGTIRHEITVLDTPFTIEFFQLGQDPHDRERFRRRRPFPLLGRQVWLPTVEDVIITKVRWAHVAGRAKDRDDARDVIAVQDEEGRIDWGYVLSWCDRHGTLGLLDEIRRSIPPL